MASKEAYQRKYEAQLKEWDAKLAQLSAKAAKATAQARIEYEDELESLKRKRAVALKTLEELSKRGEDAWEDLKEGAEKTWSEMGKAMDHVAGHFR